MRPSLRGPTTSMSPGAAWNGAQETCRAPADCTPAEVKASVSPTIAASAVRRDMCAAYAGLKCRPWPAPDRLGWNRLAGHQLPRARYGGLFGEHHAPRGGETFDSVDEAGRGLRPLHRDLLDQGRRQAQGAWIQGLDGLPRPQRERPGLGDVRLG